MRRARVLVATTAIALGLAVAGCSTGGTPSTSGSAERCTEAQINALLSGAGFQLPPLVAGTADASFSPPEVIEGASPACLAHISVDLAGIRGEGSVAVIPGGQAALDALEAHFQAQGWNPTSTGGYLGLMVGDHLVGATMLTAVITDPAQLAEFENPEDLVFVSALRAG